MRSRTYRRAAAAALVVLTSVVTMGVVAQPASAATGAADPTFGTGGQTITNTATSSKSRMTPTDLLALPDGSVLAVSTEPLDTYGIRTDVLLERHLPDGTLDPTYGTGGFVIVSIPGMGGIARVATQSDGKIIIGTTAVVAGVRTPAFARVDGSGALDPSFGTNGVSILPPDATDATLVDVAVDGADRIIGAAKTALTGGIHTAEVVRLLPNGTADTSMPSLGGVGSGRAALSSPTLPNLNDFNPALVAVAPDSSVVVGGQSSKPLRPFSPRLSGSSFTRFDGSSFTAPPDPGVTQDTVLGGLLATNTTVDLSLTDQSSHLDIVRFLGGALDSSFGVSGRARAQLSGFNHPLGLTRDSSGRLIEAGAKQNAPGAVITFARFTAGGVADTTFDGDGIATYDDAPLISVVQPGQLIVDAADNPTAMVLVLPGPDAESSPQSALLVRRSAADGSAAAFGVGGAVLTSHPTILPVNDRTVALQVDDTGRSYVLVDVSIYKDDATTYLAVVRYDPQGVLDPTFGTDGIAALNISSTNLVPPRVSVAASGVTVAATTADGFQLARLTLAGAPDPTFGIGGVVQTSMLGIDGATLRTDSLGRTLLATRSYSASTATATRLLANGDVDRAFAPVSVASTVQGVGLGVTAGDGVIIGALDGSVVHLSRVDSSGVPVASFGGGQPDVDLGEFANYFTGLELDPAGRVVLATGPASNGPLVARVGADGALDPAWAGDGVSSVDGLVGIISPRGLAVDGNGAAYLAGGEDSGGVLVRLDPNGSVDTTFGGTGEVTDRQSVDGFGNEFTGVAVAPSGNIVVTDYVFSATSYDVFIARYLGDPPGAPTDTTGPTIQVVTPADGASYDVNQVVTADFTCTDEVGGSGVAPGSCIGTGGVTSGGAIDTSSPGTKAFTVTASDVAGNAATPVTVSYTVVDHAAGTFGAGGGTVSTGTNPTPAQPITAQITTKTAGAASITEVPTSTTPPAGYTLAGQQLSITAPSSTAANPMVFTFEVDAATLSSLGVDATTVQLLRNGVPVAACTNPAVITAAPDPCVFARTTLAGGDAQLGVYTSAASQWNVGKYTRPPLTISLSSSSPPTGAIYTTNVTVTIVVPPGTTATYRLDGAATKTYSAPFTISADGVHTIHAASTDGQSADATATVDEKGPTISCGAAPSGWKADNVSVACTATDAPGGLAIPADAHFSLTTSVAAGSESATATTGTRTVCDVFGHCTTSPSRGPIKVDRRGPSITLTTPADGATYTLGQSVTASYTCTDGGSGLATCSGTVAKGAKVPTSAVGSFAFDVSARDNVGNVTTRTVHYSVIYRICQPVPASGRAGSVVLVDIRLCDASGKTVSGSGQTITALDIDGTRPAAPAIGSSQTFANVSRTSDYAYLLVTGGLSKGAHTLHIRVGTSPTVYNVTITLT